MEEKSPSPRSYKIELTDDERSWLKNLIDDNKMTSECKNRCRALMLLDEAQGHLSQLQVAKIVGIADATVGLVARRFLAEGLELAAIGKRKGAGCGKTGPDRLLNQIQTMQVLKMRSQGMSLREIGKALSVSHETVRKTCHRATEQREIS